MKELIEILMLMEFIYLIIVNIGDECIINKILKILMTKVINQDYFKHFESPNWQSLHPNNISELSSDDKSILSYIENENKYTNSFFSSKSKKSQSVFNKIWSDIPKKNTSLLQMQSNILYYQKFNKSNEYPIILIKKFKTKKSKKITLLDFNKYAQNYEYFKVNSIAISRKKSILCYGVDTIGNHKNKILFYDVNNKKHLPYQLDNIAGGVFWFKDEFIYHEYDENMRASKIYFSYLKDLISLKKDRKLIYKEDMQNVYINIFNSYKDQYVFLNRSISDSNEVFISKKNSLDSLDWCGILPMSSQVMYSISTNDKGLYILINDTSKQYRVVFISYSNLGLMMKESYKLDKDLDQNSRNDNSILSKKQKDIFYKYAIEVVKHDELLEIENITVTKDFLILNYIDAEGLPVIKIGNVQCLDILYDIKIPNKFSAAYAYATTKNSNSIYYSYQSLNCPSRVYKLRNLPYKQDSMKKIQSRVVFKSKYKFDDKKFEVNRLYIDNKGIKVPVSIVHRKGIDKNAKMLLHGYGAYGISYDLTYDNNRKYLLNKDWIYAYAHIRGGGELGDKWYYDGYMNKKKNTFDDFSSVISGLIERGYTSYNKLSIIGGSAGGLVMGNAIIDHPKVKAAILLVPFLTPLATMLNADLPLTPGEYTEWGNPAVCNKTYDYIKSYDPYLRLLKFIEEKNIAVQSDNIIDSSLYEKMNKNQGCLPNMFIHAALSDPLVTYWEPLKYIAALRSLQKNEISNNSNTFYSLLNMDATASHKGKSGVKSIVRDLVKRIVFLEEMVS